MKEDFVSVVIKGLNKLLSLLSDTLSLFIVYIRQLTGRTC